MPVSACLLRAILLYHSHTPLIPPYSPYSPYYFSHQPPIPAQPLLSRSQMEKTSPNHYTEKPSAQPNRDSTTT